MAGTLPTTLTPMRSGGSREDKARVLFNEFGEGYRQRLGDGINMINSNLNLQWVGSSTDILALVTHFEERAGYQSFTINATWNTTWNISATDRWTCETWSLNELGNSTYSLSANLRKEFDLV